ncbi:META domain-containing protein [Streptomyces sp. LBL]|uniref:META domain-containing protein n=1 Tax=Streptomyces sp. LBL TaxID=2940562 RepID=UPI00247434BF|nr:META domain-containing protein [Streptomyces sp. LBL]
MQRTYRQKQRLITPLVTTAVVALLPLAAACGNEKAGGGEQAGSGSVGTERPVTGVRWNVDSVTVDGRTHRAHGDTHLTFDKKTGKAGGRLGCNHVNAKATVDPEATVDPQATVDPKATVRDGHITLGAPSTTRMMCDASLMDTEKTLLSLFNSTLSYRVDADTLTLTSENGNTLRAVAEK